MWRFIVVLACALCVADATGLIGECDETCLDEQAGKQCPPACGTCPCTGHSVRMMTARIEVAVNPICETDADATPPPPIERGLLAPAPSLRPPIV